MSSSNKISKIEINGKEYDISLTEEGKQEIVELVLAALAEQASN